MSKFVSVACLLAHFCFSVSAQNPQVDSLLSLLQKDRQDTSKVVHLNHLASVLMDNHPDTAMYYADSALELANKLDFKRGIAMASLWKGSIYSNTGKFDEALKNYSVTSEIARVSRDQALAAKAYNNIGLVYYRTGAYDSALVAHGKSLEIRKQLSDDKGMAGSFLNIGIIHYFRGNYPEALRNYFASLKKYEAVNSRKGMALCYGGLGLVYEEQKKYVEAMHSHNQAMEIAREFNMKQQIGNAYNNIGNVCVKLRNDSGAIRNYSAAISIYKETGDLFGLSIAYYNTGGVYLGQYKLKEALENFQSSLTVREQIGDKLGAASSQVTVASVYLRTNKKAEAERMLKSALGKGREIGSKPVLAEVYRVWAELDSARGNFKGAWMNHKLYIVYRDSIDNEESTRKSVQAQMSFEFEKKSAIVEAEHKKELEHEKLLGDEREKKQKMISFFVVGGLLLVLGFAIFVYRSLHQTRKQKKIIEEQKHLVEEKAQELAERQKEILDSIHYAQRIQKALLTPAVYIDRKLKQLNKK